MILVWSKKLERIEQLTMLYLLMELINAHKKVYNL
jgi:hypothetical protein